MADKQVIGRVEVEIRFRGEAIKAVIASNGGKGGTWSLVRGGQASWIPKDQGQWWQGDWYQETDSRVILQKNDKSGAAFILRNFHFPPDTCDRFPAYMSWTKTGEEYEGEWEPLLTDELLALIIAECERIQEEIKQIAIDMGLVVAGIFDPTPVSGIVMGIRALERKELLEFILCAAMVIPYLGDLLGAGPFAAIRTSKLQRLMYRLEQLMRWTKAPLSRLRAAQESGRLKQMSRVAPSWADGSKSVEVIAKEADAIVPRLRNPRFLRKHVEADHGKLVKELEDKGFVKVKVGNHGKRGGKEDSDIWVRRIQQDGGEPAWEAVRVDIRTLNKGQMGQVKAGKPAIDRTTKHLQNGSLPPSMSPGARQGLDKTARQAHMRLGHPSNPESLAQMNGELNSGRAMKGDFTHWHHEVFPDKPGNLEKYLKGPLDGTKKLDFSGRELPVR